MALSVHGGSRKLWVFDFDDTLVKTDSRVFLVNADGSTSALTPSEFVILSQQGDSIFDFQEFALLINPRPLKHMDAILRQAHHDHGSDQIVVLSARGFSGPIQQYVDSIGFTGIKVVALGTADPHAKARWIMERLAVGDIDELDFFDDSFNNVVAVRTAAEKHPHIKVTAYLVLA